MQNGDCAWLSDSLRGVDRSAALVAAQSDGQSSRICIHHRARGRTSSIAACSALSRRRRPTVTQFPVTRCQICQRTVACRPGALSQTLTDDYRRVHPERWASPPSNTRITRPGEGRTRSCP
jgi:hypothetical protein